MQDFTDQLNFIFELDNLKRVRRRALIKSDNNRFENSAEHSWHVALTANVWSGYADSEIDISRVTLMLLIHDIVEIEAGDTFAFEGLNNYQSIYEKEAIAANRLFGLLPTSQCERFKSLWHEFEEATTADARFAKAIDRVLPLLQNIQNNGGSWVKNGVKKQQVLERNRYLKSSAPKIWVYVVEQIELAVQAGWLKD